MKRNLNIRLAVMGLILFGWGLFIVSSVYAQQVPNAPSDVYIDYATNILKVRKPYGRPQPFVIKGLCWSAATRAPAEGPNPLDPSQTTQYGFFFDWDGRNPQGHDVLNYWLKNQLLEHITDIPLIRQTYANTIRIYHSLGSNVENYDNIANQIRSILDECYRNNLMVIMTVAISKADLDSQKYLTVVNAYKNHPAILLWAIGNEWNFNLFYDVNWNLEDAAGAVNQAAYEIKQRDQHHPVSSILGDDFNNFSTILTNCPNVDVWGLNVYRGDSFGNLFEQWQSLSSKPFYLSEFGIDSYYTISYTATDGKADNVSGQENQPMQADVDVRLWREIKEHLSVKSLDQLCLGGLIFEFNDELWKVGSYHVGLGGLVDYSQDHSYDDYNNEGFVCEGIPDGVLNEEYFGLVNADRIPKLAYRLMQREWETTAPIIIHTPITRANQNTPINFTANIRDYLSGVSEAKVYWSKKPHSSRDRPSYQQLPMTREQSNFYRATLAASRVKPPALIYYLEAKDMAGNIKKTRVYEITVK